MAAIWMAYRSSCLAIRTVLLSGVDEAPGLSRSVCTFHVPRVIGVTLILFPCFLPLVMALLPAAARPPDQEEVRRQAIFGAPFLARSSCQEVGSGNLKKAA